MPLTHLWCPLHVSCVPNQSGVILLHLWYSWNMVDILDMYVLPLTHIWYPWYVCGVLKTYVVSWHVYDIPVTYLVSWSSQWCYWHFWSAQHTSLLPLPCILCPLHVFGILDKSIVFQTCLWWPLCNKPDFLLKVWTHIWCPETFFCDPLLICVVHNTSLMSLTAPW